VEIGVERACREGRHPDITDFLKGMAGEVHLLTLRELVKLDLEYDLRAHRPRLEDYLGRFPALEEERSALLDLIRLEARVRRDVGENVDPEEYARRFPSLRGDLDALLGPMLREQAGAGSPPEVPDTMTTPPSPAWPSVPGYEIVGELGRGGMGVVYKARDLRVGRMVALKLILVGKEANPPSGIDRRELEERLQAEVEAIGRLNHPGIIHIYDTGPTQGGRYLVLELCSDESLAQRLGQGPLPPNEAALLGERLAEAVQTAHEARVVHRDLKPANVLFGTDGTPKIADFGLARCLDIQGRTVTGAVLGTPSYMAPEQADGKKAGPAADVYALGAILYECLTGRPPFKAATAVETLRQVTTDEPVAPRQLNAAIPRDLETIVLKCLEKAPDRRFPTSGELAEDLRRHLAGEPIGARPASLLYLSRKYAWKHLSLVIGSGVAVIALLAAAIIATGFWLDRIKSEQVNRDLRIQDAMSRGSWKELVDLAEQGVKAEPARSALHRLRQVRGLQALGDGRVSEIIEELLARSNLTGPERAEAQLRKGDLLLIGGNSGEGHKLISDVLEEPSFLSPADREYALGLLSEKLNDALDHHRAAIDLDRYHHGARLQLAYLLVFAGRWEEAQTALAVGEQAFPDDPTFVVIRLVWAALQDDGVTLKAAGGRLDTLLGAEIGNEFRRAIEPLQGLSVTAGKKEVPTEQVLIRFSAKRDELVAKLARSPAQRSLHALALPPLFDRNLKLLNWSRWRSRDKQYPADLAAAARNWPDAIIFLAQGRTLLIQKRYPEAADALEAAAKANTFFPVAKEHAMAELIMTHGTRFQPADAKTKEAIRPRLLWAIRELQQRYRGAKARRLAAPAWGQSLGWIMSDLAWRCDDFELAEAILKEWERIEPNSPILWAERALTQYHARVYDPAIEAARKALDRGLNDSDLKGFMDLILKDAPVKLRELADKYAQKGAGDRKP
jgi:tetratricopeptide (TPR) repeat protein